MMQHPLMRSNTPIEELLAGTEQQPQLPPQQQDEDLFEYAREQQEPAKWKPLLLNILVLIYQTSLLAASLLPPLGVGYIALFIISTYKRLPALYLSTVYAVTAIAYHAVFSFTWYSLLLDCLVLALSVAALFSRAHSAQMELPHYAKVAQRIIHTAALFTSALFMNITSYIYLTVLLAEICLPRFKKYIRIGLNILNILNLLLIFTYQLSQISIDLSYYGFYKFSNISVENIIFYVAIIFAFITNNNQDLNISDKLSTIRVLNNSKLSILIIIAVSISIPGYFTFVSLVWAMISLLWDSFYENSRSVVVFYLSCLLVVMRFIPNIYPDIGFYLLSWWQLALLVVMLYIYALLHNNNRNYSGILSNIYSFILENAYLTSLLVIYLCGLQTVNILNAMFLLFFLVFLLFPELSRIGWIQLVVYTEIVIALEYIYSFSFVGDVEFGNLWGISSENLWSNLTYYLVILIFSLIQLSVYDTIRRMNIIRYIEDVETELNSVEKAFVKVKHIFREVFQYLLLSLCLLSLSLPIIISPTLFDIGYFIIFSCLIGSYQLGYSPTKLIWIVISFYPAVVFTVLYLYQFQTLFQRELISDQWKQSFGLEQNTGVDLFLYLLRHLLVLILCVMQYRYGKTEKEEENESYFKVFQPFFVVFKKFSIKYTPKIIFILSWRVVVPVNLVGGVLLLYLLCIIPFNKLEMSKFILMVYLLLVVIVRVFVSLPIVSLVVPQWIGIHGTIGGCLSVIYLLSYNVICSKWRLEFNDESVDVYYWPLFYQSRFELLNTLNYLFSNIFRIFGYNVCLLLLIIAAIYKNNPVSFVYLVLAMILLAKRWWVVSLLIVSLSVMAQYVLDVAQITTGYFQAYDYFLLVFFAMYYTHFERKNSDIDESIIYRALYPRYFESLDRNFTQKPRSLNNQIKYMILRYFYTIIILSLFVCGCINVDIFGFVYLLMSLYLLNSGESLLLLSKKNKRISRILLFYDYIYIVVFTVFRFIDFRVNSSIFGAEINSKISLFFILLLYRQLLGTKELFLLKEYIKKDMEMSSARAREFELKQLQQIEEQKQVYTKQVYNLRQSVMVRDGEVEDWIRLIGKRSGDMYGYVVVDKTPGNSISMTMDEDDQLRKTDIKEIVKNQIINDDNDKSLEEHVLDKQNTETAEELLKVKTRTQIVFELIIQKINEFSTDYTDLYATESLKELREKDDNIVRLARSVYHLVLSHTCLICYICVYVNQIINANLFSIIPTLAVLLVGMVYRPYPKRVFWKFMNVYCIVSIMVKYLFQFNIINNDIVGPDPNVYLSNPLYVIGIQRQNVFRAVLGDLFILISSVAHRGVMKRLGLWYDRKKRKSDQFELKDLRTEATLERTKDVISSDDKETEVAVVLPDTMNQKELMRKWNLQTQNYYYLQYFYSLVVNKIKKLTISPMEIDLPGKDFYIYYFTPDLFVFILTIIFWTSFSGDYLLTQGNQFEFLSQVVTQNKVPGLFAAILMINFTLIIIDRAIYTAKSLIFKIILHYCTVLAFSVWIFFVLPISNSQPFNQLNSLQFWFFVKCVYWYFSGMQIKSGFPRLRFSHYFMRNYSQPSRIGFILYRAIPFVWELRALIDWTLTNTTLELYNWLKFEDIFANLYLVKCSREIERKSGRYFGETQSRIKILNGCLMTALLVILLWFPIILLAIPGATTENPVIQANVKLGVLGFQDFYEQSLPASFIQNFTQAEFDEERRRQPGLIPSYLTSSILQRMSFNPTSMSFWTISPSSRLELLTALNQTKELSLALRWEFTRREATAVQTIGGQRLLSIAPFRADLYQLLLEPSTASLVISHIYPLYIHAFPNGPAQNLASDSNLDYLGNISISFKPGETNTSIGYWDMSRASGGGGVEFTVLSDNVPAISQISSYGVLGLYVAVVLAAGRFIRLSISDLTLRIVYEDLPHPDPVLKICSDTILAREFGDFLTEEMLYWQLINLFRNPVELMKKTKLE